MLPRVALEYGSKTELDPPEQHVRSYLRCGHAGPDETSTRSSSTRLKQALMRWMEIALARVRCLGRPRLR